MAAYLIPGAYGPPPTMYGSVNPTKLKRVYFKLINLKFDLKISHKTKIYPNQIMILGRNGGNRSATLFRKGKIAKGMFECQNTVTGQYTFLTYYEIQRYYLGRNFQKSNRVSIAPWQITSTPKIKWNEIQRRRFVIIDHQKDK